VIDYAHLELYVSEDTAPSYSWMKRIWKGLMRWRR
jgi:hypothetical protein